MSLTEHIRVVQYFEAYKLTVIFITNISAVLVYCTMVAAHSLAASTTPGWQPGREPAAVAAAGLAAATATARSLMAAAEIGRAHV